MDKNKLANLINSNFELLMYFYDEWENIFLKFERINAANEKVDENEIEFNEKYGILTGWAKYREIGSDFESFHEDVINPMYEDIQLLCSLLKNKTKN